MSTTPRQEYNLSDKDFQLAVWLYEHRPQFWLATVYIFLCIAAVLFVLTTVQGIIYVAKSSSHSLSFLRITQGSMLFEDPALAFAPEPLEELNFTVIRHKNRGADFLIEFNNPNKNWVASSFDYAIDIDGSPLPSTSSFALPGIQYRASFRSDSTPFTDAVPRINNVNWRKISTSVDRERLILQNVPVINKQFVSGDKNQVVDTVTATLKNQTPFGFWKMVVIAWVYKDGKILGVGELQLERVAQGEERTVEIGVGILPVSSVDKIEIVPQINLLDEGNFM
jgi:hypothetical protein